MAIADQCLTDRYAIYLGDCMEVMPSLPTGSIHLSVYSPPFGGLFTYSSSDRDLSNSTDYDEFFDHYAYIFAEIARVTMPGRMTAVHCMDIPTGNTGRDGLIDFSGDIVEMHVRCRSDKCTAPEKKRRRGECGHGWFEYAARYHVWKEPLTVRNRTMTKSLAHKSVVDDSSRCSAAGADYLLVFRRHGENPIPITHPTGLMEYAGEREIPADIRRYRGHAGNQIENRYSHWIWRQYASAFWDDVRLDRVLPFREARDSEDERHIHPLQLDVIDRALVLWSNPGETVLTPFMGVGSEVFSAVRAGRRGLGMELKPSYYRQAVKNLEAVDTPADEQDTLFAWAESAPLPAHNGAML